MTSTNRQFSQEAAKTLSEMYLDSLSDKQRAIYRKHIDVVSEIAEASSANKLFMDVFPIPQPKKRK
jgi:hypothetical protein